MTQSGLTLQQGSDLPRRIRSYFERTRIAYLSAREDPRQYKSKWQKMVERIQSQWDDTDDLARTFKEFVDEDDLEQDPVGVTREALQFRDSSRLGGR